MASSNYVYIQSDSDSFVHSLEGDGIEQPWQVDTLLKKDEDRRPFLIIPAPAYGVDNLSVLPVEQEAPDLYAFTIGRSGLAHEAQ